MIGAPTFIARSMTLQIFSAYASDSDPPKTVKSWLKTNTVRPSISPWPVTTPSPRNDSVAVASRLVTNASSSTNESGIEQQVETFARRQLAGFVLLRDARLAAALPRRRTHLVKAIESLRVGRHRCTAPFGLSLRKDRPIIVTPRVRRQAPGYPQIR